MPTGIEWTDEVWNAVVGCRKVSEGCRHCYAKTLHDQRRKAFLAGKRVPPQYEEPFEVVQLMPERLTKPLSWRKPRRIFVNSVSDLFHVDVPNAFILKVFSVMAQAERHTFQVLTKRPERMLRWFTEYLPEACSGEQPAPIWPLPNVHVGVSVENQAAADERIPLLLETPAAVRWLSCEPLLGPVDLSREYLSTKPGMSGQYPFPTLPREHRTTWLHLLDWVVVGGENAPLARPMHPQWARSLRDQCVTAGVPFFFKQWGSWGPQGPITAEQVSVALDGRVTESMRVDAFPEPKPGDGWQVMYRDGKTRAGRELDGREWNEYPASRTEALL